MADPFPTCCICGRAMRRATKPHWVFNPDYSVKGQAHSSCTQLKPWAGHTMPVARGPLPELQFQQWAWDQEYAYDTPEWDALMLALHEDPSMEPGRLAPLQEELLRWWQEGTRHISAEAAQATRAAYDALLARWRAAKLPPVPEVPASGAPR
jgi:hypothetical protein